MTQRTLSILRTHDDREIPVPGVYTRDAHLRSADFFDADNYPTISFRSTKVQAGSSGTWAVTGNLTVRDVTRPVTLRVDFEVDERCEARGVAAKDGTCLRP